MPFGEASRRCEEIDNPSPCARDANKKTHRTNTRPGRANRGSPVIKHRPGQCHTPASHAHAPNQNNQPNSKPKPKPKPKHLLIVKSGLPNATAEVDRDILPVEVLKRGLRAVGDFRIAEVSVGGAERVPLRPPGEDEILKNRHGRKSQAGRTAKKRKKNDIRGNFFLLKYGEQINE